MKPLNENLAYDCSNLNDEQLRVFSSCLYGITRPRRVYYDKVYNSWLHVTIVDGTHIEHFTDAKTLFE